MDQETLNDIADTLGVSYRVTDNLSEGKSQYHAQITLTNSGKHSIKNDDWAIYFCHIRMLEPSHLPSSKTYELKKSGIAITHINGCLFRMSPTKNFKTLKNGDKLVVKFKAQYFSVARSDIMPNWYMLYPKLKPTLIKSTCGEEMKFVEPFDQPETWKRFDYELVDGSRRYDYYNPYNLQERFDRQKCAAVEIPRASVIPTPLEVTKNPGEDVNLASGDWCILAPKELQNEAKYLSEKLKLPVCDNPDSSTKHQIQLAISLNLKVKDNPLVEESYTLNISDEQGISITGGGQPGVFYGVQSLLSLAQNGKVPQCDIKDAPRYSYRGMHLDVSRNFHTKDQVLKLLDVMAMYKMNKFHFHLTDDEGWRLEIPGLEELTTVGSRRGHVNKSDLSSLLPLLGAGPGFNSSGTGHYTVAEYREILQYAQDRHIEVIPEIDMPGHSHAAIRSMKARHAKYTELKNKEKARQYLLTDFDHDIHGSHSVQMFSENAMNPGLESTYAFVKKVIDEVKKMHEDIQPLQTFHFGGDEVPYEAWDGSPACSSLVDSGEVKDFEHLMEYFVTRVADIVAKCGLNVGAWQDGVTPDEVDLKPIKRSKFTSNEVYVYAWQNVWESGLAGIAYRLANMGYKVVMAQGTHLYFDHPYEPDPEERGLYWACRFLDSRKAFTFMPDNIYGNADVKLTGEPLPKDYVKKHKEDHDELTKPENVIGIQAQLWTELVRTSKQMDEMIYPRLLCVAERAWHRADWETETDPSLLREQQLADWSRFASILGQQELTRLDNRGVMYHLPPPGAHCTSEEGKLELNCAYPGLPVFYSTDKGNTWTEYTKKLDLDPTLDLHLCTRSVDGKRQSRTVIMEKPREQKG